MKTKAFCPNCGTENEGMPGGRVTCRACTASFEVPRGSAYAPPPEAPAPPPAPSVVHPPPSLGGPPMQRPTGYVGPPPTGFSAGTGGGQQNQLAVVSLVLGIACCIPFASLGAIITGVMAIKQIDASQGAQRGRELAIGGIALGGLSFALSIISVAINLLRVVH